VGLLVFLFYARQKLPKLYAAVADGRIEIIGRDAAVAAAGASVIVADLFSSSIIDGSPS